MKRIALIITAIVFAACSGTAMSSSGIPIATPENANAVETPLPDPTSESPSGTQRVAVGEVAGVTVNDEAYLDITVTQPSQHKNYGSGDYKDVPARGKVFLQVFITYLSRQNGASYNMWDWTVYVDGVAVDDFASTGYGPDTQLGSGELPKGRQAKGWLLYEVPVKGEILLSYKGTRVDNDAPIFEVVVRKA